MWRSFESARRPRCSAESCRTPAAFHSAPEGGPPAQQPFRLVWPLARRVPLPATDQVPVGRGKSMKRRATVPRQHRSERSSLSRRSSTRRCLVLHHLSPPALASSLLSIRLQLRQYLSESLPQGRSRSRLENPGFPLPRECRVWRRSELP